MKLVLKLTLGIILTLIIAILLTWYIKKPQKPEIFELRSENLPKPNLEAFKNIPVEVLKPQAPSKPISQPQPTEMQQTTTSATSSEEITENIEIIITAKEFKFVPAEITTKVGIPILIVFKNEEKVPLDFKISNENWSIKSDLVAPGTEVKIEVKFPKPGEYKFYSTVPIAQEKKMEGKIIVE